MDFPEVLPILAIFSSVAYLAISEFLRYASLPLVCVTGFFV